VYQRLLTALDRGMYDEAPAMLDELLRGLPSGDCPWHREFVRMRAYIDSRRGRPDAINVVQQLWNSRPHDLRTILDHISVYRYQGLAPAPQMDRWIRFGLWFLRTHSHQNPADIVALHEHQGYYLMTEGRLQQAREILENAVVRHQQVPEASRRTACRLQSILAEIDRRLGNIESAQSLLEAARREQSALQLSADLADYTLPYLAKLQGNPEEARSLLAEAQRLASEAGNPVGEARALLLEARIGTSHRRSTGIRKRIDELRSQVPVLENCRLLARILSQWDTWTGGRREPDGTGDSYWGL